MPEPATNPYRVLMEGIESFAAILKSARANEEEDVNWAYTSDGRKFISSRPAPTPLPARR